MKQHILKLEGIDCPSCAQRIEEALNTLPNTKEANIDFNTNMLYIYTDNLTKVMRTITHIEPQVSVSEASASYISPPQEDKKHSRELLSLGMCMAVFMFCMAVLYIDSLHIPPIVAYILLGMIYIGAGIPIFSATWRNFRNKIFFDENSLMFFATLAALCIGEISEAVAVMLFFRVGEFLESRAVQKSKDSINALLHIMPDIAHKKHNGSVQDLHPKQLCVGDIIVIRVGEKVPTDGKVLKGKSYLDMRSINGESVPVSVNEGQSIMAGAINTTAMLEVRVEKPFKDSHIAKIAKLTQEASANKAKTQKVITSFARIYTPIILVLSLGIAIMPPLFDGQWHEWIYRALVVMMISCPCALVIAVPLGYFAAIGQAGAQGILFKGSIYLESLAQVKNIVFDKTGTLTQGVFEILSIVPNKSYTQQDLLELAALAEQNSNHPIALCIKNVASYECDIESYEEISGKGVRLVCNKGEILAGNATLMQENHISFTPIHTPHTIIYIALENTYVGYILIGDKLKNDTKQSLLTLKHYGIKHFAILSGDNQTNVDSIAKNLGISHAYGHLLPAQKADKLASLMQQWQGKSAFIGDGINDAIVLRRSDVGISINTGESGNDVSKESADIILQHNYLQGLVQAFKIAHHTHSITWQNISFALASKIVLIILGIMGIANMWLAVFGDVGIALLALLNAMRPPHAKA
ncbi:heavy metal translocating P-type ATPase [Helicobacter sp. MIT 21-1697]|uniref:heavy metal translocating P-type ATPase n=1 Tax=Helicobacter sp. MIT 21-1697 TaxID=2993733 RepID=UPI00224A8458|nr:heavy metal translocating P-type ATPase [Helicobacter sp. MIT 21-1697]MCX2716277.1 heavy metal translocating P-type ATPase [Helicobacter sp. MIT 21-1697]